MKRHWLAQNEESRTSTLAASLKECKKHCFPKLYISLKIDWECERSFSAMRRLRTWLRTSMSSQQFSALAIINIHRNHSTNYMEIVQKFFILHPRKFNCVNLVFSVEI